MPLRTLLLGLSLVSLGFAQRDVTGSKDHPILTRYPGSVIRFYSHVDFDKYPLALAVANNRPSGVKNIEGATTKITYQIRQAGRRTRSFRITRTL